MYTSPGEYQNHEAENVFTAVLVSRPAGATLRWSTMVLEKRMNSPIAKSASQNRSMRARRPSHQGLHLGRQRFAWRSLDVLLFHGQV